MLNRHYGFDVLDASLNEVLGLEEVKAFQLSPHRASDFVHGRASLGELLLSSNNFHLRGLHLNDLIWISFDGSQLFLLGVKVRNRVDELAVLVLPLPQGSLAAANQGDVVVDQFGKVEEVSGRLLHVKFCDLRFDVSELVHRLCEGFELFRVRQRRKRFRECGGVRGQVLAGVDKRVDSFVQSLELILHHFHLTPAIVKVLVCLVVGREHLCESAERLRVRGRDLHVGLEEHANHLIADENGVHHEPGEVSLKGALPPFDEGRIVGIPLSHLQRECPHRVLGRARRDDHAAVLGRKIPLQVVEVGETPAHAHLAVLVRLEIRLGRDLIDNVVVVNLLGVSHCHLELVGWHQGSLRSSLACPPLLSPRGFLGR
mmetsp:Transcript_25384/g.66418  ORF Transcript_25384/g.66418 Transcript_25384/m.66418 type:complete len:372 (-) Transcript_25384:198-1313(-)